MDKGESDKDNPRGNTQAKADGGVKLPCGHKTGGRNLIVCIDGTANQFGDRNTNVIELYRMILKKITDHQHTWYNSGIGTYAQPHWKSFAYYRQVLSHWMDMAIAWNFEKTVQDAYRWLSNKYQEGDCIFLFGFSRGAFQVRVLAAMIEKVGLIHEGNEAQIPFAYELYADPSTGDGGSAPLVNAAGATIEGPREMVSKASRFKAAFSREVTVHFAGAWDTVSSIGFSRSKKTLPGTTEGMKQVCYFRHALALDERRVKFQPEYAYGGSAAPPPADTEANGDHAAKPGEDTENIPPSSNDSKPHTLEVWFAGTHSDIGGGNVYNAEMNRSTPPLRWMVQEAESLGLRVEGFTRNLTLGEQVKLDESLKGIWHLFEILPFQRLTYSRRPEAWGDTTHKPHLGSGRKVHEGQKIHGSLIFGKATYTPRASLPIRSDSDYPKTWSQLLEDGVAKRHGLLESDLYDYTKTALRKYIAEPAADNYDFLERIAEYGTGAQALYDEIIEIMERWRAETPPALDNQRRLRMLNTALGLLRSKAGTLALRNGLSFLPFLFGDRSQDKDIKAAATTFFRQLTHPCVLKLEQLNAGAVLSDRSRAHVLSVAFSPDGTLIAASSYTEPIRVWDATTGRLLRELKGHTDRVTSVAFSSNGTHIVSGSYDESIRIWDARTGDLLKKLEKATGPITSLAFSSDEKRFISGSARDNWAQIWDTRTEDPPTLLHYHHGPVYSIALSSDEKQIASGSYGESIGIWDAQTGCLVRTLKGHTSSVNSVAFSSTSRETHVVSGSIDGSVRIWDAQTGNLLRKLEEHTGPVESVAFSSDGTRIVSGSEDKTVGIWDAQTGRLVRMLEGHTNRVNSVAISSDGTRVASGSDDGSVRVWDVDISSATIIQEFSS